MGEAIEIAGILGVNLADLLTEPAADHDEQEALALAALGAAERQVHYLRSEVAKAAAVAEHHQSELEQATEALRSARSRLDSLTRRVPNPRTIQPKE